MAMRRLGQTDAILFGFLVVYVVTNLILVYWVACGYLQPWPVLEWLTLYVPLIATAAVIIVHYSDDSGDRRVFHPLAVVAFTLAMILAFYLNALVVASVCAAA